MTVAAVGGAAGREEGWNLEGIVSCQGVPAAMRVVVAAADAAGQPEEEDVLVRAWGAVPDRVVVH